MSEVTFTGPNAPLLDAREKLHDFLDKRGAVFVDNILQNALQDTKIIMILMALGLDPEKEILSSIANEVNRRLNKQKETQNANHD